MVSTTDSPKNYSQWFILVVAVFVTSLLTANIISVKLVEISGLVFPAGVVIFPVSYIFGDILTEVYGYRRARKVIWLGFLCNLLVVLAVAAAIALPPAGFWGGQEAFVQILGFTPRLLLASFAAYLVGEFANAFVLARLKMATAGRWLWLRTISSTVIGQGLDSMIFITIAFWGTIPLAGLTSAVVTQWLIKSAYEALATPLTYLVVNALKRVEGVDAFDRQVDFNPLRLAD